MLAKCQRHAQRFDQACKQLVSNMRACGWCGRVALGGPFCSLRKSMVSRQFSNQEPGKATQTIAPSVLANPPLLQLAKHEKGAGWWYGCQSCSRHGKLNEAGEKRRHSQARLQVAVGSNAAEMRRWVQMMSILYRLPPGAAGDLSVVRCGVQYSKDMLGYVHALEPTSKPSLLSGPLINWAVDQVKMPKMLLCSLAPSLFPSRLKQLSMPRLPCRPT